MEKIIVVVRRGLVESVFSTLTPEQAEVEVLDLDTTDPDDGQELTERLREVGRIYRSKLY